MDRHPRQDVHQIGEGVSRRRLIAGMGTGVAVLAAGVAAAPAADGAPKPPGPPGGDGAARHSGIAPDSAPITSSIASAPVSGWTYRSVSMYAFRPFDPNSQVTWGGQGVYPAGVAGSLRAEFEIPPGALVRDVEFYLSNSSTSTFTAEAWQYAPGTGLLYSVTSTPVPPNSGIAAYRAVAPSTGNGPYPLGSCLLVGLSLPADGTVQINGARVGFGNGAGDVGILDTPVRAYDSRSVGGPIAAGTTRVVTLPADVVAPGVTGVLVNVTAVNATRVGFLKIYPASGAAPAASAINFVAGSAIANAVVVGVSAARQVKIFASATTDVILDVSGTVS